MSTTNDEWTAKCRQWVEELRADGDRLGNGLDTVVADLATTYGVFAVLDSVSRVAQQRYADRGVLCELFPVLVAYAQKAVRESNENGFVSGDTLTQLGAFATKANEVWRSGTP